MTLKKKNEIEKDKITKKKKTKRQKGEQTKYKKDVKAKRQRPKRESNIVTSGQFRTLAMFSGRLLEVVFFFFFTQLYTFTAVKPVRFSQWRATLLFPFQPNPGCRSSHHSCIPFRFFCLKSNHQPPTSCICICVFVFHNLI